jgi:hypothetical protein
MKTTKIDDMFRFVFTIYYVFIALEFGMEMELEMDI